MYLDRAVRCASAALPLSSIVVGTCCWWGSIASCQRHHHKRQKRVLKNTHALVVSNGLMRFTTGNSLRSIVELTWLLWILPQPVCANVSMGVSSVRRLRRPIKGPEQTGVT